MGDLADLFHSDFRWIHQYMHSCSWQPCRNRLPHFDMAMKNIHQHLNKNVFEILWNKWNKITIRYQSSAFDSFLVYWCVRVHIRKLHSFEQTCLTKLSRVTSKTFTSVADLVINARGVILTCVQRAVINIWAKIQMTSHSYSRTYITFGTPLVH